MQSEKEGGENRSKRGKLQSCASELGCREKRELMSASTKGKERSENSGLSPDVELRRDGCAAVPLAGKGNTERRKGGNISVNRTFDVEGFDSGLLLQGEGGGGTNGVG